MVSEEEAIKIRERRNESHVPQAKRVKLKKKKKLSVAPATEKLYKDREKTIELTKLE